MELDDIQKGMLVQCPFLQVGHVHNIHTVGWMTWIYVKLTRNSVFNFADDIIEFKPEQIKPYIKEILVRPDDFALFCENDDGTFSHEAKLPNLIPYKYPKERLVELGFQLMLETDHLDIAECRKKQAVYYELITWFNRPDGHGGVRGGTMDEFLSMYDPKNPYK